LERLPIQYGMSPSTSCAAGCTGDSQLSVHQFFFCSRHFGLLGRFRKLGAHDPHQIFKRHDRSNWPGKALNVVFNVSAHPLPDQTPILSPTITALDRRCCAFVHLVAVISGCIWCHFRVACSRYRKPVFSAAKCGAHPEPTLLSRQPSPLLLHCQLNPH